MLRFASVLLVVSLAASAATINTISLEVGLDTGFDFDSVNGTSTSLVANLAAGSYSLSAVLNTSATGTGPFTTGLPLHATLTDLSLTCLNSAGCGAAAVYFQALFTGVVGLDSTLPYSITFAGSGPAGNYGIFIDEGASGFTTPKGTFITGPNLSFEHNGVFSVANNGSFSLYGYFLTPSMAGNQSVILPDSFDFEYGDTSAVPEPATAVMASAGLIAAILRQRRRRAIR